MSRLIQILGRLARPMSGLPELKEQSGDLAGEKGEGEESGMGTPVVEKAVPVVGGVKVEKGGQHGAGGQGGKGKKKKGKK